MEPLQDCEEPFFLAPGYNFEVGAHSAQQSEYTAQAGSVPGCILAIDYGRRRIGVAISDPMGWTARPLETIERRGRGAETTRLKQIAREHRVARILVGHPLRMDGTPGPMADEAERFAKRLQEALGLPVEMVDERLTSWAADQWAAEHPESGRGRGRDEIAAAILLEDYLSRKRGNGD